MKRLIVILAVAAIAGWGWFAALPPRSQRAAGGRGQVPASIRGAIHIHTDRSDGTGSVDEVAAAAARAGLRFVVLTDHGDGTRAPSPPQYRLGVLCIDAVEISTQGGHVVALGLPRTPYPLGGEARDVLEDVARLGAFAIAAHPGSEKPELRWTEWAAPFGGIEWLNSDSEWRDETPWSLARVLFTYPARGPEALATLLDRPNDVLARWDVLTRRRRIVAVAAADAHARLGLRSLGEPYDNTASLDEPSYETMFRTFSIAIPGLMLSGDAMSDGAAVIDAIRRGHVYSVIDAVAGPGALSFAAKSGLHAAEGGDTMPLDGSVSLSAEIGAPDGARIQLIKDGKPLTEADGTSLTHAADQPGVYRVEVSLPGAPGDPPVPWMLSNPIYVGRDPAEPPLADPRPRPSEFNSKYDDGAATGWTVEKSSASDAALAVAAAPTGNQLSVRYALGGAESQGAFVALAMEAGKEIAGYDRIVFTGRATRPMRLSVQLREPGNGDQGQRWHRSIYLDTMPREITVYFDDLRPKGVTARRRPELGNVTSVLFVVDTTNTELGGSGQFWIDEVKYAR